MSRCVTDAVVSVSVPPCSVSDDASPRMRRPERPDDQPVDIGLPSIDRAVLRGVLDSAHIEGLVVLASVAM